VSVRVALVGCGGWGQNVLRVLLANPRAEVVAVADTSSERRHVARALATGAAIVPSLDDAAAHGLDAVLIATPTGTHASLVLRALAAGVDVFVEKPLATRVADAERCAARAAALGRVAMVGHLLRYHPTIEHLYDMAHAGALGRVLHLEAARLSVAGDRFASPIWTLGPHDLSVVHALDASLDASPIRVTSARGAPAGDPVHVEAELASGFRASIALSGTGLVKERRICLVGSAKTARFDDVRAPDRLIVDGAEVRVPWSEPLAREVDHFLRCVEDRARPRTPFEEGVTIVRALAQVEELVAPSTQGCGDDHAVA
jgi:predicted dehydrogenase